MDLNPFAFRNLGKKTATAGTVYTQFVEPLGANVMTLLQFAQLTVGTTAHTWYAMRPLSVQTLPSNSGSRCSCYLSAAAAGNQAVININQDPGVYTAYNFNGTVTPKAANNAIAANDYVAYQYPDGTWEVNTVSSVSTLAITLTTSLSTGSSNLGLAVGAPVWFFGINTDTNPYDGLAHPIFNLAASSTLNLGSESWPWMSSLGLGEPILLYNANATVASTMERLAVTYANRVGVYGSYA